ncbi:hypothetical protein ALC57_17665, partial [Trachymyrmex cornetzi]
INKVKSLLLKNCPLLRIDSFVQKHVNYLRGVLKIVAAQSNAVTNNVIVSSADLEDLSLTSVEEYNSDLIGVASYKKPITRSVTMGHYTAICSRKRNWIEYNHLDKRERRIKENVL